MKLFFQQLAPDTHTTTRSTPLDTPFNMSAAGPQPKRSQYYMDPDNLDEELAKVPLFMSKLPEEENDTLEALQSLVYDGPPEGIKRENIYNMIQELTCLLLQRLLRTLRTKEMNVSRKAR